ncbi:MAG: bifunctional phosphoribosylaminoimidazolecarboxamide formyltransferase/IMP cyclohydrolase [Terriglobales bacterium]
MNSSSTPPRRALLSVSDKAGLAEFAQRLEQLGFELYSTGGTARALRAAGLKVRDVTELTEFPEMLEGRVKTLHPRVHGALLGRWRDPEHRRQMEEQKITPIELLVVNLYPFEQVAARAGREPVARAELIENIDIGGPSMLRSGAKNFESVAVVTDPADYDAVAGELASSSGVSLATRWRLAQKAFQRTAAYDRAIAAVLTELPAGPMEETVQVGAAEPLPARLELVGERVATLRYGENPHQRAALYRDPGSRGGLANARLLQGKELSYNNLVDLEAASELAAEFDLPAVAIIKHTNPAGCATSASQLEAYQQALACDPVSAFGGVIGCNRELAGDTAQAIAGLFVECIAAPGFSAAARAALAGKKNLRLVELTPAPPGLRLRSLSGGWLLQEPDLVLLNPEPWQVVTRRAPSADEAAALRFGWAIAKHVKSNAIVFARPGQTLAVGAGQMSRVDAVKVAAMRAQLPLASSAVASDAFFPFPDGIEEAARHGATAVIQPGGSVRDADAIACCDRLGLAMVFTGLRHFRH